MRSDGGAFLLSRLVAFRIIAKVGENLGWLKGPSWKGEFHLVGKTLCSNGMGSITESLTHWVGAPFHRNSADCGGQVRLNDLRSAVVSELIDSGLEAGGQTSAVNLSKINFEGQSPCLPTQSKSPERRGMTGWCHQLRTSLVLEV